MCLLLAFCCFLTIPKQIIAGSNNSVRIFSKASAPKAETDYSDTLIFGYSDNRTALNLGLDLEVGIQTAIKLPQEFTTKLKGNKITEIWFATGKTPTQQESYVFISRELGFTEFDYKQDVASVEEGWNKIKLDQPFELTGEELNVGFRVKSSGEVISMDGRADNDLANLIRITQKEDDNTCSWLHQSGGNMNIQVVIQGEHLPQNDLAIEQILTKPYARTHAEKPIKLWVRNRGAASIKDLQAQVYVDDEMIKQFSVDSLNIKSNELSKVTLGSVVIDDNGLHDLQVVVAKVNGTTDEDETNNTILKENIIVKEEYSDRKVLLEHFSTMMCPNCPSSHRTIGDALLYREDVIHVVHHAAYGNDALTIPASEDYTFFYSNTSTPNGTYAPGCMLDRKNMSKYGATDGQTSTLGPVFHPERDTFGSLVDESLTKPAYVSVDITAQYDSKTRELAMTVNSMLPDDNVTKYLKGNDTRLNIFLTEDSIVGGQAGAPDPKHFIHDAAIRQTVTPTWGDPVAFNGNAFQSQEYKCTLPEDWKPRHMHVIAFLANYNPANPNDCEVYNSSIMDIKDLNPSGVDELRCDDDQDYEVKFIGNSLIMNFSSPAYSIYNTSGELVASGINCTGTIDLSGLTKGIYICKIKTRSGNKVIKISI